MSKSIVGKSMLMAALVLSFNLAAYSQGHSQVGWSILASIPPDPDAPGSTGMVEGAAVSGVDNIVVVAGGLDSGIGDNNLTRRYDISTNTWSYGTPMPMNDARAEMAYGDTGHGGMIYAIGGRTAPGGNHQLEAYEVATDTWTELAPMPTGRAAAAVAVFGDALYVMGGRTSSAPCSGGALSVVEKYDIATNTWTTVAPLPSPRSDFTAVEAGGKIYTFGGCTNGTNTAISDVDVYNPVTNTWAKVSDMPGGPEAPGGKRSVLIAGIKGNQIYVMGGMNTLGAKIPSVQVYNFVKNSWSPNPPDDMITPRGETGSYSHGGLIYVPGGSQPAFGSSSNANEVLNP